MSDTLYEQLVGSISIDKLLEINRIYTYDDVGVHLMDYCFTLCVGKTPGYTAEMINSSSLKNFISTGLDKTNLVNKFDWNSTTVDHVQKPDAVFRLSWLDGWQSRKEAYVYYECDAHTKAVTDDQKKTIAVKMYQDITGCHTINPDVPGITVRSNLFKGPKQLLALDDAFIARVKLASKEVQEQLLEGGVAENALAFLHSICVAHLWSCWHIVQVLTRNGVLAPLAEMANGRRYDLHLLIGRFTTNNVPALNMFNAQHGVDLQYYSFAVSRAALVQVLAIERFNDMAKFKKNLLGRLNAMGPAIEPMTGLLDVSQFWELLAVSRTVYTGARPAGPGDAQWRQITEVLGDLTITASTVRPIVVNSQQTAYVTTKPMARTYLVAANIVVLTAIDWPQKQQNPPYCVTAMTTAAGTALNCVQDIVALYHANITQHIYKDITCHFEYHVEASDVDYLHKLKVLKLRSRLDGGSLTGRQTAAKTNTLFMHLDIGHRKTSQSLEAQILFDMYEKLPTLDPELATYLTQFNAPNIELFLRMIRCSNMLSVQQLAANVSEENISARYARTLQTLPLGSVSELMHILEFTRTYARHAIHSNLTAPAITAVVVSPTVNLSKTDTLMAYIIQAFRVGVASDSQELFEQTPLYSKLLLCKFAIGRMVMSIHRNLERDSTQPEYIFSPDRLATERDELHGHLAIHVFVQALQQMYRPATVYYQCRNWPAETGVPAPGTNAITDAETCCYTIDEYISPTVETARLQALDYTPGGLSKAPDAKWMQLTWPARDSNIVTRPNKAVRCQRNLAGTTTRHVYYKHDAISERRRMHLHMNKVEVAMFAWILADANPAVVDGKPARQLNKMPVSVIKRVTQMNRPWPSHVSAKRKSDAILRDATRLVASTTARHAYLTGSAATAAELLEAQKLLDAAIEAQAVATAADATRDVEWTSYEAEQTQVATDAVAALIPAPVPVVPAPVIVPAPVPVPPAPVIVPAPVPGAAVGVPGVAVAGVPPVPAVVHPGVPVVPTVPLLSEKDVIVYLRWKRLSIAAVMMSAVNGLMFQAINASRDSISKEYTNARAGLFFVDHTAVDRVNTLTHAADGSYFALAFEYWGATERHASTAAHIVQNGWRFEGVPTRVWSGGILHRVLMALPMDDFFVVSNKMQVSLAVHRTRRNKELTVAADTLQWVFGENIGSHRHEVWLSADLVLRSMPIYLLQLGFAHEDLNRPKIATRDDRHWRELENHMPLEAVAWPTYEALYTGIPSTIFTISTEFNDLYRALTRAE